MAYYKDPDVEALYDIVNKHNVKNNKKIEELKDKFRTILSEKVKNINVKSRRTFTFSDSSHLFNVALKRSQWATDLLMEYKEDISFSSHIDYQIFLTLAAEKLSLSELKYFINKSKNILNKQDDSNKNNTYFSKDSIFDTYLNFYYLNENKKQGFILHNASKNKDPEVFKYLLNHSGFDFQGIDLNLDAIDPFKLEYFLKSLKEKYETINVNNIISSFSSNISQDSLYFIINNLSNYFPKDEFEKRISDLFYFLHAIKYSNTENQLDILKCSDFIIRKIKQIEISDIEKEEVFNNIQQTCLNFYQSLEKKQDGSYILTNFNKSDKTVSLIDFKKFLDNHFEDFHLVFEKKNYNDNYVADNPEEYKYLFSNRKLDLDNDYFKQQFNLSKNDIPNPIFLETIIQTHQLTWSDFNLKLSALRHINISKNYINKENNIEVIKIFLKLFAEENKDNKLNNDFLNNYKEERKNHGTFSSQSMFLNECILNNLNSIYLLFLNEPQLKEDILKCNFPPEQILLNIFDIEMEYKNKNLNKNIASLHKDKGFTLDEFIKYSCDSFIQDFQNCFSINQTTLEYLNSIDLPENYQRPSLIFSAFEKYLINEKINLQSDEMSLKKKRL